MDRLARKFRLSAICAVPPGASRAKGGLLARSERVFRGAFGAYHRRLVGSERSRQASQCTMAASGRRRLISGRRVAKKCAT